MAKTAMNQLEEQIEVIRKEAYDAGYAAAMQAIRTFASSSASAAVPAAVVRKQRKSATAVKPQPRRSAATAPKPKSTTASMPKPTKPQSATAPKARSKTQPSKATAQPSQPTRGTTALLIAEVLKGTQSPTRAADIRKALQRDKGVSIAFTSIRHALNQLAQRGEVKASADHKEWRYVGTAAT